MLRNFPRVRRWEETDDVLQNTMLRLTRTLQEIPVHSVRDYVRLASTQIRREIIDLAKHHFGPLGLGANYHTPGERDGADSPSGPEQAEDSPSNEPEKLAAWAEWHQRMEELPDEEREVVDLLWYHGLTQLESAAILGISLSTVQRRWQAARIRLVQHFAGEPPT
jgi:RNA polymerase sigma-70 factor (ECF subfamily)